MSDKVGMVSIIFVLLLSLIAIILYAYSLEGKIEEQRLVNIETILSENESSLEAHEKVLKNHQQWIEQLATSYRMYLSGG